MRIFNDFDEFKSAIGTEIGMSDWVEVTQGQIERFADATGDDQWIHVDVERAKRELPTGKTIAHGLLTLALAPDFIRAVARARPEADVELWGKPDPLPRSGPFRFAAARPSQDRGRRGCAP
jgi:acyl dehydratase